MIKWPRKKKIRVGIITEPWESGFNFAIDLCIEAEKNGRMSEKEIVGIVSNYINFHNMANTDHRTVWKELAHAIHTALYGDTKPDERKET